MQKYIYRASSWRLSVPSLRSGSNFAYLVFGADIFISAQILLRKIGGRVARCRIILYEVLQFALVRPFFCLIYGQSRILQRQNCESHTVKYAPLILPCKYPTLPHNSSKKDVEI